MANAKLTFDADANPATRAIKTLGESVDGASKQLLSMSSAATTLGGALGLASFTAFITKTIDGIDALNDLRDATGSSVEMLSALEDRASRTGTSMDVVGSTLIKFNSVLKEAAPGSPLELALQSIGLRASELRKLDPSEALRRTSVALAGFADDGNKARLTQDLFGKSVAEVAPLLNDLAEGGNLVATVTTKQADEIDKYNKQMAVLSTNVKDLARSFTIDLVTAINKTSDAFSEWRKQAAEVQSVSSRLANAQRELAASQANDAIYGDTSRRTVAAQKLVETLQQQLEVERENERLQKRSADAAAANAAAVAASTGGKKPTVGNPDDLALVKKNDALIEAENIKGQERLQKRIADLQLAAMTEVEIERMKMAQIQSDLDLARNVGLISTQEHNALLEQLELEHQARLGNIEAQGILARQKFEQKTSKDQLQFAFGQMAAMTAGVSANNRALFNINKVAAIAEASVALPAGVSKTWNSYPYPWNIPMAALHLVTGLAHIKQIKDAQYGTSSSAPSIGGGGATPVFNVGDMSSGGSQAQSIDTPGLPKIAAPKTQINITLQGSQFSYEQVVNEIIPLLNQAGDNGADIRVNGS
ncbi:hypothetical protein P3G55_18850 [Leptospira sp. 96542]|nr:hypothetical protein [Leptospira sp. 96542]